jgi:hypothetical protein
MKKTLAKYLVFSSAVLLILSSCKKSDKLVTSDGGKPGALTASATTLVLDKTKLNDPSAAITFTFTSPQYTFADAVTNTIQIDPVGDNWANPSSTTLGLKETSHSFSTVDLNALLLKLKLTGGVSSKVQVRVQHSLSAQSAPIYSNVVTVDVTPFNLAAFLYTVGAFQGWDINHQDSLLSATSNGIYTGIINFTTGNNQFLVVPGKGSYDNKYATDDAQNSTSSHVKVNGANNFYAPATAGYYTVTLNLNLNTISFTPANYYSVIGSVTPGGNFSTDADLKFVNSVDQDWEAVIPMTNGTFPGSFKVRQNHDWTWSWGIPKTGADGVTLADSNDDNVPIAAAGNYKVTFSIVPTTVGDSPSATAKYTVTKQ